jgi:hypothetical protein
MEKAAIALGIGISLVAFVRYLTYSSRRLWYDEIYTAIIALQPSWRDMWKAWAGGLDMQPPIFFAATRVSAQLLGPHELALRLPEILGMLLFSWCMYFFVAKRMGVLFGLSAMMLPLVTDMEFYAGEARPYGILLGVGGLALLAWRNAIENPRRRAALPLFAASLALFASAHAYAIVTVALLAVAEMTRYLSSRRADFPLWTCFLAALLPLPLYFAGLRTARGIVLGPERRAHWSDFPLFYEQFFHNRIPFLILFGVLAIGLALLPRSGQARSGGFPRHEAIFAGILAISPICYIALAIYVTGLFFARYAIFAVAGMVIVAILLIDAVAPSRQMAARSLCLLALFLFGMDQLRDSFDPAKIRARDAALTVPFGVVPPGVPLVIASGLAFLPAEMYAADSDLSRTYYLTDRAASLRYSGSTIFDTIPNLAPFHAFKAHLADYRAFTREHKTFFAFGPYVYCDSWQIQRLIDDGAKVTRLGRYDGELTDNYLVKVELPY